MKIENKKNSYNDVEPNVREDGLVLAPPTNDAKAEMERMLMTDSLALTSVDALALDCTNKKIF